MCIVQVLKPETNLVYVCKTFDVLEKNCYDSISC